MEERVIMANRDEKGSEWPTVCERRRWWPTVWTDEGEPWGGSSGNDGSSGSHGAAGAAWHKGVR